jgi:hypothetical protein
MQRDYILLCRGFSQDGLDMSGKCVVLGLTSANERQFQIPFWKLLFILRMKP